MELTAVNTYARRLLYSFSRFSDRSWESGIAVLEDDLRSSNRDEASLVEKRATVRVCSSIPAFYRLVARHKGPWCDGNTIDISEGGVRLLTRYAISIDSYLELHLKVPDSRKIMKVMGSVVWSCRDTRKTVNGEPFFQIGVAFENLKSLSGRGKMYNFFAERICQYALKEKSELTVRPAQTLEEIEDACRLLYREYVKRGYCCEEGPLSMHYNHFVTLPESRLFVLLENSEAIGTISFVPDSPCGLPMESTFSKEIQKMRRLNTRLAEVGLLALDGDQFGRKKFSMTDHKKYKALFTLFAAVYYGMKANHISHLAVAVHPRHKELYQYLGFEQIGHEQIYSDGKSAIPMMQNVNVFLKSVEGKPLQKFFELADQSIHWDSAYKWTSEAVKSFLIERKNLWEALPKVSQDYLAEHYPVLLSK